MKTLFTLLMLSSIGLFGQTAINIDDRPAYCNANKDTLFVKPDMFDLFVSIWQMDNDTTVVKPIIVCTERIYGISSKQRKFEHEN